MKWEHEFVHGPINSILSRGKAGWELVAAAPYGAATWTFFFKRPLEEKETLVTEIKKALPVPGFQVGSGLFDTVFQLLGEIQGHLSLQATTVDRRSVNTLIYQMRVALMAAITEDPQVPRTLATVFLSNEFTCSCIAGTCPEELGEEDRDSWCDGCALRARYEVFKEQWNEEGKEEEKGEKGEKA